MTRKWNRCSMRCPFCNKIPDDMTFLLSKKVRDASVLLRCDDCEFMWGRTT